MRGKSVVITGAGDGIGRAIALAFARAGGDLVLGDVAASVDGGGDEARRAGARAETLVGDVSASADMQALARRAIDAYGRLDVLITCAGIGGSGLLAEQDEAAWLRVIDVNLGGTYRAIRAVLPTMMAQ